jgi:uncharacterized OsmC-like protein
MADVIFRTKTELSQGLTAQCEARGFSFTLDGLTTLGGNDKGMNPAEALLSTLGACKCIIAKVFAEKLGINLKSVQIDMEGVIDPDGVLEGKKTSRSGFSHITTRYYIDANNTESEVRALVDFVEHNCPVTDTIIHPPAFDIELHCCK